MRSATPCCVSSLMWLQFVEKRQKTKANHLDQFPVDQDTWKYLHFGTLICSTPSFTAVTGVHFLSFLRTRLFMWPCKSFPIEEPKPSLFSLLLNSSLMEFLNELLIRQFWASASSCDLLWTFLWNLFFVKMNNSLSLVVFCSSGTCYNLITFQLQASAFRFSGMCTVEAAWSCMLFQCCVFVVFLLCCSF